jgi:beta-lactamase class A
MDWNNLKRKAKRGCGTLLAGAMTLGGIVGGYNCSRTPSEGNVLEPIGIEEVVDGSGAPKPKNTTDRSDLEISIQNYVDSLRDNDKARERGVEDYTIYVQDLSNGEVILDINSGRQQMSASSNKVFFMMAYFHQVEKGRIKYTNSDKKTLEKMIRNSNNGCTNKIINRVNSPKGKGDWMDTILDHYGFDATEYEKIPKGGRTIRNLTTSEDLAKLFTMIYAGDLPHSEEMVRILELGASDKLVHNTCIPIESRFLDSHGGYVQEVGNKTGTIYGVSSDAGVISARFQTPQGETVDVPYFVSILIEDKEAKQDNFRGGYDAWSSAKNETIRSLHEAIYWDFLSRYSGQTPSCNAHKGVHPK